jgi:4-alpha-glucanotransferase
LTLPRALVQLARAWGVDVSYRAYDGSRRRVSPDALVAVLRALGAPVERPEDAPDALRARIAEQHAILVEPVTVAWDGEPPVIDVRTGADAAPADVELELELDDGSPVRVETADCEITVADPPHDAMVVRRCTLPGDVPFGAHRIRCAARGRSAEATLLCAPRHAYQFPALRAWGLFAPVYALRTHPDDPLPGDLGDLRALAEWSAQLGADVIGTLPILATFLDAPYEPSPYSPVSRRFWNELYAETRPRATGNDAGDLVDLRAASSRKRAALEAAAARGEADEVVRAFASRRPDVERYARFRAAVEQHGADWTTWPPHWRTAGIPDDAIDPDRVRYHRYAQAVMDDQLQELATRLRSWSQALYLDFPLGTHRRGFDVWDQPGLFVDDASVGAPPDQFFSKGQDWGFPPVHPHASRADGHAYFGACIDHHLTHAGLLRLDHVIGLHRMWWVPPGHDASDGAFVRYPTDELYARLCLASVRHAAALIGENLGTVPPEVNRELRRHRIGGMHVAQFEIDPDTPGGVRPPQARALTAIDTHDTATFAGFWTGAAINRRVELGVTGREAADRERLELSQVRPRVVSALRQAGYLDEGPEAEPDARSVLGALLELLGRSRAQIVLVSLEDLWLELHAQNVPGTTTPQNWRRPADLTLDELKESPDIIELVRRLATSRSQQPAYRQRARDASEATLRQAQPPRARAGARNQHRARD